MLPSLSQEPGLWTIQTKLSEHHSTSDQVVSETLSNNHMHERAFLVYTFVSRELVHRTRVVTSQEAYERCADSSIDGRNTCVNDLLECLRIITSHLRASVQLSEDALKTLLPVIKVPAPKSTAMVHGLHGRRVSDLGSHNLTNILGDAETTTGILKHLAQRATSICEPPYLKRKAYVHSRKKPFHILCESLGESTHRQHPVTCYAICSRCPVIRAY